MTDNRLERGDDPIAPEHVGLLTRIGLLDDGHSVLIKLGKGFLQFATTTELKATCRDYIAKAEAAARLEAVEKENAVAWRLLSHARHPFCPCTGGESVCKPKCVHSLSILSYSCRWCLDRFEKDAEELRANPRFPETSEQVLARLLGGDQ